MCMRGSKVERLFVFLPAICSSVSWSACGWRNKKWEGGRELQTMKLLNKTLIPSHKPCRHCIPGAPHTPSATRLDTGRSVQGSELESAKIYPWKYHKLDWGLLASVFLNIFYLKGISSSKQNHTVLNWSCLCNGLMPIGEFISTPVGLFTAIKLMLKIRPGSDW